MREVNLRLPVAALLCQLALGGVGWACSCSGNGCNATADDCPDGCYAVCGSGGCSAGCVGGGGGPRVKGAINFTVQGVSASELQERLAAQLGGGGFLFVPSDATAPFSVEFRQVSPPDILQALSKHGAVALFDRSSRDPKAGGSLFTARLSLRAEEIEAGTVVKILKQILGGHATVRAEEPGSRVSLDLQGASIRDSRSALWKIAGIWVDPEGD